MCVATKQMSILATGEMSDLASKKISGVVTGQIPSNKRKKVPAVPESSGFAWACGASQVAPAGV